MSGNSDQLHKATLSVYSVSYLYCPCLLFFEDLCFCNAYAVRTGVRARGSEVTCVFSSVLVLPEPDGPVQPWTPEAGSVREQLREGFPRWELRQIIILIVLCVVYIIDGFNICVIICENKLESWINSISQCEEILNVKK